MVPPVGYEWVRDDTDAILVNITTGQILHVQNASSADPACAARATAAGTRG